MEWNPWNCVLIYSSLGFGSPKVHRKRGIYLKKCLEIRPNKLRKLSFIG